MNVDAVVVTFNRLEKLKECLSSLNKFDLKNIFVIDNASSDGTGEYLKRMQARFSNIKPYILKKNIGGAGGFNVGMKRFIQKSDSDYVWIMDDDTIPQTGSMNKLISEMQIDQNIGFSIGQVYWTDGTLAKMNLPVISKKNSPSKKVRYVEEASFVAIMFSRQAVIQNGYPISDFFIWGDDVEYTGRITRNGFKGIQVMDAEIIHKMGANVGINILDENTNKDRIQRYFYNYRNRLYLNRKKGLKSTTKSLCGRLVWTMRILFLKNEFKLLKLKVLYQGTVSGLKFNPPIEKC